MAIPDTELRACLRAVGEFLEKRRPPVEIRDQVDIRADITGSVLLIFEVRSAFREKARLVEQPVAKVKWIDSRKTWRLFWHRADLKWHSYPPLPEATAISTILDEVDRDPNGCFFG